MYSIHHAGQEDVADIARIHVACWSDTYTFMPQDLLDKRDISTRHKQWAKEISSKNRGSQLFAVRTATEIIGFGFVKISGETVMPTDAGELHALYLVPKHRRSSAGPIAKIKMIEHHLEANRTVLSLWAFKGNGARIWYRQMGWEPVINRNRMICGHVVPETGYIHTDPERLILRLEKMAKRNPAPGVKNRAA